MARDQRFILAVQRVVEDGPGEGASSSTGRAGFAGRKWSVCRAEEEASRERGRGGDRWRFRDAAPGPRTLTTAPLECSPSLHFTAKAGGGPATLPSPRANQTSRDSFRGLLSKGRGSL